MNEKITEAMEIIKAYCEEQNGCEGCYFDRCDSCFFALCDLPCDWDVDR